ncbi:MAG: HAMP domain-containing sensor histidine kinase [Patescibacteria group bacterium]
MNQHSITETTSVISHQLKTPLSAIKSSLEVVLAGDIGTLNKDQREYMQLALESAKKMITLVKDLLDASKIEEGRMQLVLERADPVKIVQEVVADLSRFAEAKNTKITFDAESGMPEIQMDLVKIQQVVNNILFNAIRYSRGKGQIMFSVKKDGENILFACRDNGIGIAESDKDKMFGKFYRSPQVSALAPDGSGLGLYISKAIIELSGGKIWFESEVDKGTTFYFTLPIQ